MAEYIRQDHHLPHGSLEPTITNGDRIRMMTDEELAEFLWDEWMDRIICDKMDTKESMLKWLMKEVEDGNIM